MWPLYLVILWPQSIRIPCPDVSQGLVELVAPYDSLLLAVCRQKQSGEGGEATLNQSHISVTTLILISLIKTTPNIEARSGGIRKMKGKRYEQIQELYEHRYPLGYKGRTMNFLHKVIDVPTVCWTHAGQLEGMLASANIPCHKLHPPCGASTQINLSNGILQKNTIIFDDINLLLKVVSNIKFSGENPRQFSEQSNEVLHLPTFLVSSSGYLQ